jgi:Tfp pilus assembly protein PilF
VLADAKPLEALRVSSLLDATPATAAPEPPQEAAPAAPVEEALPVLPERPRASTPFAEAKAARRQGQLSRARSLYRSAARQNDATAEIALLRYARLELDQARIDEVRTLLREHAQRFPRSRLAVEASWLEVQARLRAGDRSAAREAARLLIARFPGTPQAQAAARLLEAP